MFIETCIGKNLMMKFNNNLCHHEISKKSFDIIKFSLINQYKFMMIIVFNSFDPNPTKYLGTL